MPADPGAASIPCQLSMTGYPAGARLASTSGRFEVNRVRKLVLRYEIGS
jgi:hypothetical protein